MASVAALQHRLVTNSEAGANQRNSSAVDGNGRSSKAQSPGEDRQTGPTIQELRDKLDKVKETHSTKEGLQEDVEVAPSGSLEKKKGIDAFLVGRAQEVALAKEKKESKRRRRKKKESRHRRRRRDDSSRSETSSASSSSTFQPLFRATRGGSSAIQDMGRRCPGGLLKEGLSNMRKFLAQRGVVSGDQGALDPVVVAYLTTVLQPALGNQLSNRSSQELRTLAEVLDLILRGQVASAADFLMQRFKAVEVGTQEGWNLGKHLELTPSLRVTAVGQAERAAAVRMEKLEAQTRLRGGAVQSS